MPHWSCHYYRLETGSSFIVGNLQFGILGSLFSMLVYSTLILVNLFAISYKSLQFSAALGSGILHLILAFVHISRLINPFDFEVFGYTWSIGSSIREVLIVLPFGIVCIGVAIKVGRLSSSKTEI